MPLGWPDPLSGSWSAQCVFKTCGTPVFHTPGGQAILIGALRADNHTGAFFDKKGAWAYTYLRVGQKIWVHRGTRNFPVIFLSAFQAERCVAGKVPRELRGKGVWPITCAHPYPNLRPYPPSVHAQTPYISTFPATRLSALYTYFQGIRILSPRCSATPVLCDR